jgi:hypothetical protein
MKRADREVLYVLAVDFHRRHHEGVVTMVNGRCPAFPCRAVPPPRPRRVPKRKPAHG